MNLRFHHTNYRRVNTLSWAGEDTQIQSERCTESGFWKAERQFTQLNLFLLSQTQGWHQEAVFKPFTNSILPTTAPRLGHQSIIPLSACGTPPLSLRLPPRESKPAWGPGGGAVQGQEGRAVSRRIIKSKGKPNANDRGQRKKTGPLPSLWK